MGIWRVLSFVLVSVVAGVPAQSDGDAIPSIFSEMAPRGTELAPKLEAPEVVRSRLPISTRVRAALNERVAEKRVTAPAAAPLAKWTWTNHGDAILMERFVVAERREEKVEVESVPTYLAKAFTTGDIFRTDRVSVQWGLSSAVSTSYGALSNTPRVHLSVSLRFQS